MINSQKQDNQREQTRTQNDLDHIRRDIGEKSSLLELQDVKAKVLEKIETRVELREVQTALNECQSDITEQLKEFKTSVNENLDKNIDNVHRQLDAKATTIDVQEALDKKTDKQHLSQGYADRSSLEMLQN